MFSRITGMICLMITNHYKSLPMITHHYKSLPIVPNEGDCADDKTNE
jgi:hypothetical protein